MCGVDIESNNAKGFGVSEWRQGPPAAAENPRPRAASVRVNTSHHLNR